MPADAKFPMVREVRYAGVEAGGTTWVVAIAAGDPTRVVERASFATGDRPDAVLAQVVAWLAAREFDTLGVASFGPIDLHRHTSPRHKSVAARNHLNRVDERAIQSVSTQSAT